MGRIEEVRDFTCEVCGGNEAQYIDFSYPNLPTKSKFKKLHSYSNVICAGCAAIHTHPKISEQKVIEFYNTGYRTSEYAIEINGTVIEPPIQIPWSGISFKRFYSFYESYRALTNDRLVKLSKDSSVLDIGAYQGMFLYAFNKVFSCRCVACDYSEKGIEFAKNAFGFSDSKVTKEIEAEQFGEKFDVVCMVHSLEHIRNPVKLMRNIRTNLLKPNGLLYIEIPNPMAYPLDDPTHLIMYSADALRYLLQSNGFYIEQLEYSGFGCEKFIFHTSKQNICCLARIAASNEVAEQLVSSREEMYREIKESHRRTSWYSLLNGLKKISEPFGKAIKRVAASA